MYEEILERNSLFIKNQKMYRSFDTELQQVVNILNTEKIICISGLRHIGKIQLIHLLLKKTDIFNSTLYFNGDLDIMKHIKTREDFTILFDLFVRISGVPKLVVLHNIHHITGIKSFIGDLYKTKKYKILIVENILKINGVKNIEVFPLRADMKSQNHFGGIPQVRVIPDNDYKTFVLETLKNSILLQELHHNFNIKNMASLEALLHYLASSKQYQSLREIHRGLKDHGLDISLLTMIEYINACESCKLISRNYLYDTKNSNTIRSKAKYYFGDVGLQHVFDTQSDSLENLIYIELKIEGYTVSGGLNGRFQFAFIATKGKQVLSIALDNSGDKSEVRKTARKLEKIADTSEKYVIIPNKNSLNMRKFDEESVKIIDLGEFFEIVCGNSKKF